MSFSRAAEELFVTPAAISHQIHALEQDLGVKLFHRLNRAIALTASAQEYCCPGLSEAFSGIQSSVRRLRAHNDTGSLTVTASPSFAAKWLVLRLHQFQEQYPEVDVRISATDEVVDLTKGDFDIAIRYGTGHYPGLDVELLFTNEVFPACSPQLLAQGPPLRTPDDLRRHALIHDQAVERDPLVPTWPMWLKAAGAKDVPATAGPQLQQHAIWRWTRRSPATAWCWLTARLPPPISPPAGWFGCSRWRCPINSPTTSLPRRARWNGPRSGRSVTGCAKRPAAGP